jgi:hypothetical protein
VLYFSASAERLVRVVIDAVPRTPNR